MTNFLKKWAPVLVLSLGLAIIIIDTTLLNVSLANLVRDLHTDIQSLQWVITAYSLTLAALTITGGRLGDLFGRKKMFVLGAAIFAIGSFVVSISNSVGTMIIGESIIEGVGAALMMPATASLLVSTYKGRDRAIAMGMWGGVAGAASAVGPILGGFLTTNYSWRWGFRINIVVAAILIIGSIIIKECRDREEKPNMDFLGIVLSSFGLLALVFGIIESSSYGWWKAKEVFSIAGHNLNLGEFSIVPLSMALGIILLTGFVFWELKVAKNKKTPLVSMKLFKNRQFTSSLLTTAIMAVGQAGLIFSFPVFLQAVRGLDAYHTGLAFLPMSITSFFAAPLSVMLVKKISPKRMIQAGLIISMGAMVWMRGALNVDAVVADFYPGMILYGLGLGLMMSQISNMSLSAVSVEEAGEASGVNNTFRQLGSSLGSAIIGAALLTALSTNLVDGIKESKVIPEPARVQISEQVSKQTSNVEFGGGAKMSSKMPKIMTEEITKISHQATTDANRLAVIYTIATLILGFIAAFWLPGGKNLEKNESAAD